MSLEKWIGLPYHWHMENQIREECRLQKQTLTGVTCDVPKNGKHIMIGIMAFSGSKLIAEKAFIRYFYKKGYTVDVFTCRGECACCIPKVSPFRKLLQCGACRQKSDQLERQLKNKVNFLSPSDFLTAEDYGLIREAVAKREFRNREDFIWKGVDLHDSIWYGVMRVDLKSYVSYDEDIRKIKTLAESAFALSQALQKYFHENDMLGCIVSHGMYHLYGPFLDTAVYCHVWGAFWNSAYMRPDTVYFGLNRNIFTAAIFEDPKNVEHIHLNEEQKKSIIEKMKWNCPPLPQEFLDRTKKYRKVFGMYTNIPWDGAVSNATPGFPDTRTYVSYVLEWFRSNPDCLLIIRSHPHELLGYAKGAETMWDIISQFDLPENVWFIHPGDPIRSNMIADIADASILYGGTMGIELTLAGKIAIQAGQFFWTGKGFVFECEGKDSLHDYLNRVKAGTLKLTDEMREKAVRYAWHFTYERHLDKDYMKPVGNGEYHSIPDADLMKSRTLALLETCLRDGTDIFMKNGE